MPQPMPINTSLARAAATFVDTLHHIYAGISIQPVAPYEDEDLALQITIPTTLSRDQVLDACHRECLNIEDEYNVFLLPLVVYGQ